MSQPFDFNNALKVLQGGQALTGKNGSGKKTIKTPIGGFYGLSGMC